MLWCGVCLALPRLMTAARRCHVRLRSCSVTYSRSSGSTKQTIQGSRGCHQSWACLLCTTSSGRSSLSCLRTSCRTGVCCMAAGMMMHDQEPAIIIISVTTVQFEGVCMPRQTADGSAAASHTRQSEPQQHLLSYRLQKPGTPTWVYLKARACSNSYSNRTMRLRWC